MASKWLKIGQVVEKGGQNGKEKYEVMQLDNENMNTFIELLRKFRKDKLSTVENEQLRLMTTDEIRLAQKLPFKDPNSLKRLEFKIFDRKPDSKAPAFILGDICIDVEQFN